MSDPTVRAVVELVDLGKRLRFRVDSTSDPSVLPGGSTFDSPPHLWSTAFQNTHKKVKRDIKDGRIFFVGELSFKTAGGSGRRFWRPAR